MYANSRAQVRADRIQKRYFLSTHSHVPETQSAANLPGKTRKQRCASLFESHPHDVPPGVWERLSKDTYSESYICRDIRSVYPKLNLVIPSDSNLEADKATEQHFHEPALVDGNPVGTAFHDLPAIIHIQIFSHLLVFQEPIHAISRLDLRAVPESLPQDTDGNARLLHRFHIGAAPVCLNHATRPEILLVALCVSKKWHFLGCALVYGANTFLFSSLGE